MFGVFRCESEVVYKGQVTPARGAAARADGAARALEMGPDARRASERAKESDIDRSSFYL